MRSAQLKRQKIWKNVFPLKALSSIASDAQRHFRLVNTRSSRFCNSNGTRCLAQTQNSLSTISATQSTSIRSYGNVATAHRISEENDNSSQQWLGRDTGNNETLLQDVRSTQHQDQPSWCILDDTGKTDSSPIIHKQLSSAPKLTVLDLLLPRVFDQSMKKFLDSSAQVLSFHSCPSLDKLLPEFALILRLELRTTLKRHPYYKPLSPYTTHLVKTERTLNSEDTNTSKLPELIQQHAFSQNFDMLIDDIKDRAREAPQRLLDAHGKLLLAACQDNAEAFPVLQLCDPRGLLGEAVGYSSAEYPLQIRIVNRQYNVDVVADALSRDQVVTALSTALLDFCKAIRIAVQNQSEESLTFVDREWHPSEFLSRASRVLGWGQVTFTEQKVLAVSQGHIAHDLWHVTVDIPSRKWVKCNVVWFGQKSTKLLALMHAGTAMKFHLQEAHKSATILTEEYLDFARYWNHDPKIAEVSGEQKVAAPALIANTLLVEDKVLIAMLSALRGLRDLGFEAPDQWQSVSDGFESLPVPLYDLYRSRDRKTTEKTRLRSARSKLKCGTPTLPVLELPFRQGILDAIQSNDITVIRAATGSGKTTQIPQLILDEHLDTSSKRFCSIVCTQPRRVSTVSVAHRVAKERGQSIGHEVGYQVRFDDQSPHTANNINYMTSGYLLRILEQDPESICSLYSHIILDEVHERDIDTDLILTALKNMMTRFRAQLGHFPKVILVSATIEAGFFVQYFKEGNLDVKIASVDVPGKMYPIETIWFDDVWRELRDKYRAQIDAVANKEAMVEYITTQVAASSTKQNTTDEQQLFTLVNDLMENNEEASTQTFEDELKSIYVPLPLLPLLIDHFVSTSTSGDLLVFLPGLAEIEELELRLAGGEAPNLDFSEGDRYKIFKLHSSFYETNYEVWKPVPPGCRRVVLATNIAETSITLPDIQFVIDTGFVRRSQFDQTTQAGNLGISWISKAESAQRRGRAGRTQPGTYITTFSQAQYDVMEAERRPEMLSTALDQIVLRVEASRAFRTVPSSTEVVISRPGGVLALAPSAPKPVNVDAAAHQLRNLHALNTDNEITALGKALASFPTSPAAAKSILLGVIFRCMDPMLLMGAMRDDYPLMGHPERPSAVASVRRDLAGSSCDDRIADARAFFAFNDVVQNDQDEEVEHLKQSCFIRQDAFTEMARTCRQTYDGMSRMIGSVPRRARQDVGIQGSQSIVFPHASPLLNSNSDKEDLIKALSLSTSGQRLLVWQNKNWRSPAYAKVLPSPRSVNHANSRKDLLLQRMRRETGDLLSYTSLRIIPTDKYPWACETSIVSPLMGMLFAESLRPADENILVINDWAKYEIKVDSNSSFTPDVASKVIFEYRKAIDRFIAFAMSKIALHPKRLRAVATGQMDARDFNVFFKELDQPLRKIIVDSVVEILAIDSEARKARAEVRRAEAQDEAEGQSARWELLKELEGRL